MMIILQAISPNGLVNIPNFVVTHRTCQLDVEDDVVSQKPVRARAGRYRNGRPQRRAEAL